MASGDIHFSRLKTKPTQVIPGSFSSGVFHIPDGVKVPSIYPTTDSTDSIQIRKADNTTTVLGVDTTNTRVGIGGVPQFDFHVVRPSGTYHYSMIDSYNDETQGPTIGGRSARGNFTTPTATALDDSILRITGSGYYTDDIATFTASRARISFCAAENFTSTKHGTYISFWTTPISSITIAERIRINDVGNVGINTIIPRKKLDILDSSSHQLRLTHTDGTVYTDFQTDSSGYLTISPSGKWLGIGGTPINPFYILTESSTGTMVVDKFNDSTIGFTMQGRKARGTAASPTATLANDILVRILGAGYQTTSSPGFTTGRADMYFIAAENFTNIAQGTYITLNTTSIGTTASVERMRITDTGYVGINTIGPDRKLDVLDASNPQLRLTHTDGSVYAELQCRSDGELYLNGAGATVRLRTHHIIPDVDNTYQCGDPALRWSRGDFYDVYSHDAGVHTSDERKKEIKEIFPLGLNFVNALSPISYKWKTEGKRTHFGFGAQTLMRVAEEHGLSSTEIAAYIHDEKSDTYGTRTIELLPVLWKAVQELSSKLNEAIEKISILESKE